MDETTKGRAQPINPDAPGDIWIVTHEVRADGAIGIFERASLVVRAPSEETARDLARFSWHKNGYETAGGYARKDDS